MPHEKANCNYVLDLTHVNFRNSPVKTSKNGVGIYFKDV